MAAPTPTRAAHIPAIDMVKGWAIIGVTLIHSWALADSLWMSLLFYHAVPVFLVVFGLNSESWFRHHPKGGRTREWYRRGFKRILVPAWATAAVWWVMVAVLRPPDPMVLLTVYLPFQHLIGWLNQIGTSWFVTLILQFVLLFPIFHWLSRKMGGYNLFALCFVLTMPTLMFTHWIRDTLSVPGWLMFSPRFFVHVAFGMLLAGRVGRIGWKALVISLAVMVPFYLWQQKLWWPGMWRFGDRFVEMPLTVVLLWSMARLDGIAALERPLSWLGRHSFGLYLGQMLTHNGFLYRYGGACDLYGCYGGVFEKFNLWVYTGILLLGSFAFVYLGNQVLAWNQSLRARGWPLPDLSV